MKANELNDAIDGLKDLDNKQKSSILKIIDLKTDGDMQKVLDKIDAQSNKVDTQFGNVRSQFSSQINNLETKFNGLESKFGGIESKFGGMESKFDGIDHKLDTQQKLTYGVLITIVTAMLLAIFTAVL